MLFNSISFAIFFPVVTLLYFVLPYRYRNLLLLMASCFFYMFFKPIYILILFFTIIIDYWAGILIENAEGPRKKFFLSWSLVANIGVLAIFKYYNFINDNITSLMGSFGASNHIPYLTILLPIGLSFHTFQAMSYTIEVYRGNQKTEKNFLTYALYVMFYPQLAAGPIERPQNMLHQFYEKHDFDYARVASGLRLMLIGFFKKIVVADRVALIVNSVYDHHNGQNGLTYTIAAIFFTIQMYFDFSGYSDIARGSARVMGFELMLNFNRPYFAYRLSDYWRRWHISLYSWFNDYLFTPLSIGLRDWGRWAIIASILITFSISGLWHGAAWTFVLWGFMHGVGLSIESLTKKPFKKIRKGLGERLYNNLTRIITITFVIISLVIFRLVHLHEVGHVLYMIATDTIPAIIRYRHGSPVLLGLGLDKYSPLGIIAVFVVALFVLYAEYVFSLARTRTIFFSSTALRMATYFLLLYSILFFGYFGEMQFIYFQF